MIPTDRFAVSEITERNDAIYDKRGNRRKMNTEFFKALDLLEKEKGIPKEYMIEKVEAALLTAFKRDQGYSNVRIVLDPVKKDVKVYKQLTVVDPTAEPTPPDDELQGQDTPAEEIDGEPVRASAVPEPEDDEDSFGILYDTDTPRKEKLSQAHQTKVNPSTEILLEDALAINKKYRAGDIVEIEVKPKNFGRISAQTAKQVIIQGIREAERGMMIKEYESKKDEIVTALVTRIDPVTGNVTLEIGKNNVTLFKNEQIPHETFHEGEHVKVYVMEIKKDAKGPAVVLSRTHPGLVKRLFELEVPEIQDGTVLIQAIAREAGSRTKIAVYSRDANVDPIGSCIGPKGIRKNHITEEIRGEKIDIVRYSSHIDEFIKAALSPANVVSVTMTGDRSFQVLVEDDQLSLAIGREGQNARLAAKLTGCKVDIKSAAAARAEAFKAILSGENEPATALGGKLAEALKEAGAMEEMGADDD